MIKRILIILALVSVPLVGIQAANIKVEGFGVLGDIRLERTIKALSDEETASVITSSSIENALWILDGEVKNQGYLKPSFSIYGMTDKRQQIVSKWREGEFSPDLPQDTVFFEAIITVCKGDLFYFKDITACELPPCIGKTAQEFFYSAKHLIVTKEDRFYTPGKLRRGLNTLEHQLEDNGYLDAKVIDLDTDFDEDGGVNVLFNLDLGRKYYVRYIELQVNGHTEVTEKTEGQPYCATWRSSYIRDQLSYFYSRGYPNARYEFEFIPQYEDEEENELWGDFILKITPGKQIYLNDIEFINEGSTDDSFLKCESGMYSGELLDRLKAEDYLNKMSRLGIYDSIELDYREVAPDRWNAVYSFKANKKLIVKALVGAGSYDILRGGLIVQRNNLFGYGHFAEAKAIQSFKSTLLRGYYSIPEVFDENTSAYADASYFVRKEPSYTREETIGTLGLQRYFPEHKIIAALQVNAERLQSKKIAFDPVLGKKDAKSFNLGFNIQQNKLDNPLYPTCGYKWFGSIESAYPVLFGDVTYELIEIGGSYHQPIYEEYFIMHIGLKHGVLFSPGSVKDNIPFAKRFLLGGENTVRGYKQGEAGTKNSDGQVIGDVTYILANFELQVRLTELFSIVGFIDAVGFAPEIQKYPASKVLVSVAILVK